MSSYLDKTGLERVWNKANSKFATITHIDQISADIDLLTNNKADKTAVDEAVANLVDSAPGTLNTLNELAAALGDDPNFATTVSTEIGKKVNKSEYNDTIASINANINSINEEIDSLQEASEQHLNRTDYLGPVVLEGNPIVYESGTEGLNIAATSTLNPIQEGSGDPCPAGGSKNIINIYSMVPNSSSTLIERTNNTIRVYNTTAGTYNRAYISNMTLKAGVTYTLSAEVTAMPGGYARVGFVNQSTSSMVTNGSIIFSEAGKGTTTFSVTEDTTVYFAVWCSFGNSIAGDATFKNIQVEIGNTATDYMPYENIRPISGYNAVKLVRTGKNLFSGSSNKLVSNGITLEKDRGSEVTVYGSAAITLGMRVFETQLPAGTYTFSIGEIGNVNRFEPCINGTPIAQLWSGDTWTLTLEAAADVGLNMIVSKNANCGTENNPTRIKVQLEIGADATAYEPYQGSAYSTDFGQTVYGGSLDWQTGELTVDRAMITLNGTQTVENRFKGSHGAMIVRYSAANAAAIASSGFDARLICSALKAVSADSQYMNKMNTVACNNSPGSVLVCIEGLTTEAEVTAWLAANPVTVVYPLATPTKIQLTPTQISELSGLNTLYGDGSNIHAIFNTTSRAVSTLETIPGILPVEKDGTGAISAATARTALGITPANIGALPIGGGNVTGNIEINGGENYVDLSVVRKINNSNHTACILPNSTTGVAQFTYIKDGTIKNNLMLNENHTAFMQPVNIASGGTGATDAATARSNLGVPSTTGSGASGDWGINITGNAATATALTTSAGSSSKPVYFSSGKPVAITSLALGSKDSTTSCLFSTVRKNSSDASYATMTLGIGSSLGTYLRYLKYDTNGTEGSAKYLWFNESAFYPGADNDTNLGMASYKWKTVYATTFNGSGASLTSLNASNISSGTLAKERLATSGVTAGTYGPSAAVTGNNNTTMNVPEITVDAYGRVTKVTNRVYTAKNNTYTIPTTLKNPNALTVYGNTTKCYDYDGSAAKTLTIKPGSNITVTGDTSGNITIANTYSYSLPTATSSVLGGVKVGSNITVSSGTISLSKTNVTTALGYTPLSTAGGTLTSSSDTPLTLKSGSTTSFIGFQNSSGTTLGYLGFSAANTPVAYFSGSSKTLYHSGNLKYGALSNRPSGSNGDIYLATS